MKRGLIFLFILLNVSLVYAQEINLFGQNVSIIVLTPILLIVLGLLFFLGIYLKDNWKHIQGILPKHKTKRKTIEIETKDKSVDYGKELDKLKRTSKELNVNDSFKQLSGLFKEFLKTTYHIEKQFTHGDLDKEVKKGKDEILSFSKRLEHMKYSGQEISKNDLSGLVKNLDSIISKYGKKPKIELTASDKVKEKLHLTSAFKDLRSKLMERGKAIKSIFTITEKLFLKSKVGQLEHPKVELKEKVEKKVIEKVPQVKKESRIKIPKIHFHLPRLHLPKIPHPHIHFPKIKISAPHVNLPKFEFAHKIKKDVNEYFENREIKHNEKDVEKLIRVCEKLIDSDPEKAKILYPKILELYYKIPIEYEERLASKISDLNKAIENSIDSKEEKELNKLADKITYLSKDTGVVIHEKAPLLKSKIDDILIKFSKLEHRGLASIVKTNRYFKNEFLELLHSVRDSERKGTLKVKSGLYNIVSKILEDIDNINEFENKEFLGIKRNIKNKSNKIKLGILNDLHKLKEFGSNEAVKVGIESKHFAQEVLDFLQEIKNFERRGILKIGSGFHEVIAKIYEDLTKIKEFEHGKVLGIKRKARQTYGVLGEGILTSLQKLKEFENKGKVRLVTTSQYFTQEFLNFLDELKEFGKFSASGIKRAEGKSVEEIKEFGLKIGGLILYDLSKLKEMEEKGISNIKKLEAKSMIGLGKTSDYLSEEFLEFVHKTKLLEKRTVNRLKKSGVSFKERFGQTKSNMVEELKNTIEKIKKAEKKGIKILKGEEEHFVVKLKELLSKIKEMEQKEIILIEKREQRMKKSIKKALVKIKQKEHEKIREIKSTEKKIFEDIKDLMKRKEVEVPEHLEEIQIPKISKIGDKEQILIPSEIIEKEIPEIDINVIEEIIPIKKTKDFRGLDKEEKNLFNKLNNLNKLEMGERYTYDFKPRKIKTKKKKEFNIQTNFEKSQAFKKLTKEEEMLYKRLMGVN